MNEFSFFKPEKKETKTDYEYFPDPDSREDIYQFSKGVSEYLHDEEIPNIILIDRSTRPLWIGIDEYWKQKYKNEPRPNIYFVNPDSFQVVERAHEDVKKSLFTQPFFTETDLIEAKEQIRENAEKFEEDVKNQFEQSYKKLETEKNRPLAVFDNCIHSGETFIPLASYLTKSGYQDLRIVVGETSNDFSPLKIDKEFTSKISYHACSAFGIDSGVKKDDQIIHSHLDKNAKREKVIQCREEIRRIIKEKEA
jgi:hypothetical protein